MGTLQRWGRGVKEWADYKYEILVQIVVTVWAAAIYGIMESLYIDTGPLELKVFGHFSYYHLGLVSLMFVVSFALCLSHFRNVVSGRKLYLLWTLAGSLPLALWVEDITWFIARWQPIAYDEWTMINDGWGINLGFTWVPYWYFIVLAYAHSMFWLAHRAAKAGYELATTKRKDK